MPSLFDVTLSDLTTGANDLRQDAQDLEGRFDPAAHAAVDDKGVFSQKALLVYDYKTQQAQLAPSWVRDASARFDIPRDRILRLGVTQHGGQQ